MALVEYNTIVTAFASPSAVTGEGGLREDYNPGDLGFDPLADQGAQQRPPRHDRHRWNAGAGAADRAGHLAQLFLSSPWLAELEDFNRLVRWLSRVQLDFCL